MDTITPPDSPSAPDVPIKLIPVGPPKSAAETAGQKKEPSIGDWPDVPPLRTAPPAPPRRQVSLDVITDLCELAQLSDAWDDLFRRSRTTMPTVRCAPLMKWLGRFAPGQAFRALVVRDHGAIQPCTGENQTETATDDDHAKDPRTITSLIDRSIGDLIDRLDDDTSHRPGRLLAALPLVASRPFPLVSACGLPINEWAECGDLLLDESVDPGPPIECLATGLRQLPWSLVWLGGVRIETMRWRLLLSAIERAGMAIDAQRRFDIAMMPSDGDWRAARRGFSRRHVRKVKQHEQELRRQGDLTFDMVTRWLRMPEDVDASLEEFCRLEDSGWKGRDGTSILANGPIHGFIQSITHQLARRGELVVGTLRLNGRPIAAALCLFASGVLTVQKTAYDEGFAQWSPGLVMFDHLQEYCFTRAEIKAIDYLGPIAEYQERWHPDRYEVAQAGIATNERGKRMLKTIRAARSMVRWLRGGSR